MSATDKLAPPPPDERERFEAMGYCQHLASILRKAQGVINNETKREIDVGYECATLRQICDAMRAALAARDAEYGRGLRDGIDAQKRRGNTSGCACVLADDGEKIESYCRLHGAMRDDLAALAAEVARLTEAEHVASRFNADFITEIAEHDAEVAGLKKQLADNELQLAGAATEMQCKEQEIVETRAKLAEAEQNAGIDAERIAILEEQNGVFRRAQKACDDCDAPTMAEVAELRQRAEAAESDAGRYLHVRRAFGYQLAHCTYRFPEACAHNPDDFETEADYIDQCIDTAIAIDSARSGGEGG